MLGVFLGTPTRKFPCSLPRSLPFVRVVLSQQIHTHMQHAWTPAIAADNIYHVHWPTICSGGLQTCGWSANHLTKSSNRAQTDSPGLLAPMHALKHGMFTSCTWFTHVICMPNKVFSRLVTRALVLWQSCSPLTVKHEEVVCRDNNGSQARKRSIDEEIWSSTTTLCCVVSN